MQRVSTDLTLFYKFFIPIFWIVFFGAFTISVLALNRAYYGSIAGGPFRIGVIVFFLSSVAGLYFTLMRLKRVEMDEDFVYVTDYFKTFRYPYHNIEKMQERDLLFLKIVNLYLHTPGRFGRRITFVASQSRYRLFWEQHPGLRERLVG